MSKLKYAILLLLFSPALLFSQGAVGVSSTATSLQGAGITACVSSQAANTVCQSSGTLVFEGATADGIETILTVTDPTSSDKTITLPNATGTVGLLEVAQSWTATQTYTGVIQNTNTTAGYAVGASGGTDNAIAESTANTPDTGQLRVGSTSNSWGIIEYGDATFDFNNGPCGTSACTNPTLILHSPDQVTDEWGSIDVTTVGQTQIRSAQDLVLQSGHGGASLAKSLTESSATAVSEISIAQGVATGGIVHWTIVADDGTDFQSLTGTTQFQAVNKAGTETCTVATTGGTDEAASVGTLTNTVTCTVALTDVVQIAFNAASSLTQTTLVAYHTVILNGPGTATPQ